MKEAWSKWSEIAWMAALLAACLILGALQYRWTGELSRAEATRLSASVKGRLQDLARAFDAELRREVLALVPSADAVSRFGAGRANDDVLSRAVADPERRPAFRRIAAAIRDKNNSLRFFEAEGFQAERNEAKFKPGAWPEEAAWRNLRGRLEDVAQGGSRRGPMLDPSSALIEVPVFVDEAEAEWLLFELDTRYVAEKWLPQLMRTYLNSEGEGAFHAEVSWRREPSRRVWQEPPGAGIPAADAEATMFPMRFLGPARSQEPGRWRIAARHRLGSVPAAVASAYQRNLAVGLLLLVLIGSAGIALLRNTQQARRLAEAQYQFFAGISHELRTPLTVIQGAGHNLLSGVVRDEVQRESYLRAIVKQSSQLTEMVEQLLAYGAIRKQQPLGRAALDVVISESIESAALELEQTRRSVDVDMPPDLPMVRGDAVWLGRVFGNLISNAIRHGAGEVRVTGERDAASVEVRVADSGPGIPPADLKKVFDPFFRSEQARNGRTRGTGLGLSLVKEAVERMGGSVRVESEMGKGTVFIVRLPAAE